MTLYYFHLHEGTQMLADPDGCVLPDLAAAAARAMREARSIISADVLEGRLSLNMRLDVADETGAVVHSLSFPEAVEIIQPR